MLKHFREIRVFVSKCIFLFAVKTPGAVPATGPKVYEQTDAANSKDSVTFKLWAMKRKDIDDAIKRIESAISREIHNKKFDDSIIESLDDSTVCVFTIRFVAFPFISLIAL